MRLSCVVVKWQLFKPRQCIPFGSWKGLFHYHWVCLNFCSFRRREYFCKEYRYQQCWDIIRADFFIRLTELISFTLSLYSKLGWIYDWLLFMHVNTFASSLNVLWCKWIMLSLYVETRLWIMYALEMLSQMLTQDK